MGSPVPLSIRRGPSDVTTPIAGVLIVVGVVVHPSAVGWGFGGWVGEVVTCRWDGVAVRCGAMLGGAMLGGVEWFGVVSAL